jgi:hypothetical protein
MWCLWILLPPVKSDRRQGSPIPNFLLHLLTVRLGCLISCAKHVGLLPLCSIGSRKKVVAVSDRATAVCLMWTNEIARFRAWRSRAHARACRLLCCCPKGGADGCPLQGPRDETTGFLVFVLSAQRARWKRRSSGRRGHINLLSAAAQS